MMKLSRSKFKYALRKCKRDKETIIADNIAEQLCQRDSHDFGAKNRVRFGSSHPGPGAAISVDTSHTGWLLPV